jgi:hypothetical protein
MTNDMDAKFFTPMHICCASKGSYLSSPSLGLKSTNLELKGSSLGLKGTNLEMKGPSLGLKGTGFSPYITPLLQRGFSPGGNDAH